MKRAIEEYFPIVEINRLAVPERNAFKPIYKMHKWFARRSSSVFRAILLGALKPAGTDIMEEFYRDHTDDPDTRGKVILDPFMGGGTTVVEALRLGCKVIGIDLNPVAWFIVKTEVEPVHLEELNAAFERLAARQVEWSGKTLKETLLDLYKTTCPACGNDKADIIYTFWVKSAPCTTATCDGQTPLFKDFIIARKSPSIRYFPDCACPKCNNKFDWERDPAALIGDEKLMANAAKFSAGEGRTDVRWSYSVPNSNTVACPWCNENVLPIPPSSKLKRKKVPLHVLLCPHCEEVWQFRGPLPEKVQCPTCNRPYDPTEGNIPAKGKFICRGTCGGNVDKIIAAIRTLPEDKLLPIQPYALEGYCERCAKHAEACTTNLLWKNNGKFFKRIGPADLQRYQQASAVWEKEKTHLPYPKSEIPVGEKTKSGLLAHHYRYWHQMFNERQLLALSTLLQGIDAEDNQVLKEMLLGSFQSLLNDSNMLTWYQTTRDKIEGIFTRHDFNPKTEPVENNVFGVQFGKNTWVARVKSTLNAKRFNLNPFDKKFVRTGEKEKILSIASLEKIYPAGSEFYSANAAKVNIEQRKVDLIITDPPYGGNVNYAELSDYFYVWLRLSLCKNYKEFAPEYSPKVEEVIENRTRGKTAQDFGIDLSNVFLNCEKALRDDGVAAFTFHHQEGNTWEQLLEAICRAGFYFEAVYPIHGEAENSPHLIGKESISYDLIHVCRKRPTHVGSTKRSWASIRHEIRQKAREEVRQIQAGRYGREPLSAADRNILLIGKCLELYSKHYGAIVDHEDQPVPLKRALEEIKMLVDQIISRDNPLPPELSDIDPPSYIYFTTLCTHKEIKSDDVSKNTRGIIEPAVLREHGLIIKGREKRGRSFEVKQPVERLNDLKQKFQHIGQTAQSDFFAEDGEITLPKNMLFVDCVHLLLGLAEVKENVLPWLERFRGLRPQIRAACEYLMARNKSFAPSTQKILGLLDERNLFNRL